VRLSAEAAINHPWIKQVDEGQRITPDELTGVVGSLKAFGQSTKFERTALTMMAWSLSAQDRDRVHAAFLELDKTRSGTITMAELKSVLIDKFKVNNQEAEELFATMDSNHDGQIHYSDFLAAMVRSRIEMHDDVIRATFNRFDDDDSGTITLDNLEKVLGNRGAAQEFLQAGDIVGDGVISYEEFRAMLLNAHNAAKFGANLVDREKPAKSIGNRLTGSGTLDGTEMLQAKVEVQKASSDRV